jgi:MraZ protein
MIFLGTYNHTVDTKNRLTLPSKFIEKLSNEIFISKGFDGCLEIRTEKEYKEYVDQLLTHPNTGSNARQVQRVFLGNSYKVEIDSTKRVLIPANLKEKANIDKDVFIIGVGSRIEI